MRRGNVQPLLAKLAANSIQFCLMDDKKRTGEKRPKQLLIVCLADKREEEIRGCGAAFRMKEREERECKKLGFL